MTEQTADTATALATFPKLNLPTVTKITEEMNASFKTMYTRLEAGIAELPTDMSVKANRELVASYAYRISRTKTGLDEAAKGVSSEAKAIVDSVNKERGELKTTLDTLRDKARAALDAWEAAETHRKERVRNLMSDLVHVEILIVGKASNQLELMKDTFSSIDINADLFGDDVEALNEERKIAVTKISDEIENAKRREEEARELEEFRRQKAEREQAEAAAAEAKRIEEEAAAEAERQRIERERIATEAAAKAAKDAEERVAAAERQAAEAEARREREAQEAETRREREAAEAKQREIDAAERAAAAERKRQADEKAEADRLKLAQEKADQERAADLAHRKKLNGEAMSSLIKSTGITEKEAQAVIIAIYKGQIPHVAITY